MSTDTQRLMADTDRPKLQRKPSLFRALTSPGLHRSNTKKAQDTAAATDTTTGTPSNGGLKGNMGSIRRRPHLGSIRQRLSGVFSSPDTARIKKEEEPVDEDFYYRPVPFALTSGECKTIYLMRSAEDLIEVRDESKAHAIYTTNAPGKLDKKSMPETLLICSTEHDDSKAKSPVAIYKHNDAVVCQIKGLTPIRFYKGKPDCVLKVDCFETSQVIRPSNTDARALSTLSINSPTPNPDTTAKTEKPRVQEEKPGEIKTLKYAWKHTSVCGKGGLKLVDLLDGEILAYYEHIRIPGKAFAKVKLQGSGLHAMKLVVATLLAIRAKSGLSESNEQHALEEVQQMTLQMQQSKKSSVPPVPSIASRWTSPQKPVTEERETLDAAVVSAETEQALFSTVPKA
ncbi:hypothetical protein BCR37DRAFT_300695 [Protomyces lactucae-debilis]|uniref:Uncharacterized protein n=1 Tax=Protomyces lactucae-debilis TaxID=2754530 RepID=A0A1Y2FKE8_PROLT|nr:uncharacterized protein BCR37DRAFT_300695 [Protomyces lactucae-debilis]ORY83265.1 hypothetical protein BCR37DRAFT_300695 [Protomyces lactucae-debilis]